MHVCVAANTTTAAAAEHCFTRRVCHCVTPQALTKCCRLWLSARAGAGGAAAAGAAAEGTDVAAGAAGASISSSMAAAVKQPASSGCHSCDSLQACLVAVVLVCLNIKSCTPCYTHSR
jgi:hypothetical protein